MLLHFVIPCTTCYTMYNLESGLQPICGSKPLVDITEEKHNLENCSNPPESEEDSIP